MPPDVVHIVPTGANATGQLMLTPLHRSSTSHGLPALRGRHTLASGPIAVKRASAGQVSATPSHVSGLSQTPTDARHTNVVACFLSMHPAVMPSHTSAASHGPTDARHDVPIILNALVGHALLVPSQTSAVSHGPADARHVNAAAAAVVAQVPSVPAPFATVHA